MSLRRHFRFDTAWLPEGWRENVVIGIDDDGNIASVQTGESTTDAIAVAGAAIPGMPNVHSHAFQRAMAGLAERRSGEHDSFWTWRETMYELARRTTPELLNAVAAQLYVEMLKAGYTAVCEFHYLHHQPDGSPYREHGVMAHAVVDAAVAAGIGLTLLPTLYCTSDFGSQPPTARQRQFVSDVPQFMDLCDDLRARTQRQQQIGVGAALHSLRAVPQPQLREVLESLHARSAGPIHIHIAEQEREVAECLRHYGQRPIEWLLDHATVDQHWCLVHATHATNTELAGIARSGASVALCPTTEANLGDGIFDLPAFIAANGVMAIGSDSHISISPPEELRWLEYQSRLLRRERNVLAGEGSTGAHLWRLACTGGAQASGRRVGALRVGLRADVVVLDLESPALLGRSNDSILDTFIFSGQPNPVRDVMAGGRWVVQDGQHFAEIPIAAGYRRAMRALQE
ncbi:formimidoylglutamate deiminase [Povalibacter sp.]|uniref:formimidoylglutamate deiminase n=1 Tax=Povalibacter sp. TaxID=1962978 RepID=UPI002F3F3121